MQKILEVVFNGKVSSFTVTKIDRSKLYGSKKRIPVDAQGQECSSAALTRDGKYILPTGGTVLLYIDSHGNVVERNQLRAVDPEGSNGDSEESSSIEAMEFGSAMSAAEMLEYTITRVYMLEPVSLLSELELALISSVVCQASSPANQNGHKYFLLKNTTGYFLLVGKRTGFVYIGLEEADLLSPNVDVVDDDIGDGLDFGIL